MMRDNRNRERDERDERFLLSFRAYFGDIEMTMRGREGKSKRQQQMLIRSFVFPSIFHDNHEQRKRKRERKKREGTRAHFALEEATM